MKDLSDKVKACTMDIVLKDNEKREKNETI